MAAAAAAAATLLERDWRLRGNQQGVLDRFGWWDVRLRVDRRQETGQCGCVWRCMDTFSPADLWLCEFNLFSCLDESCLKHCLYLFALKCPECVTYMCMWVGVSAGIAAWLMLMFQHQAGLKQTEVQRPVRLTWDQLGCSLAHSPHGGHNSCLVYPITNSSKSSITPGQFTEQRRH